MRVVSAVVVAFASLLAVSDALRAQAPVSAQSHCAEVSTPCGYSVVTTCHEQPSRVILQGARPASTAR